MKINIYVQWFIDVVGILSLALSMACYVVIKQYRGSAMTSRIIKKTSKQCDITAILVNDSPNSVVTLGVLTVVVKSRGG